MTSGAPPGGGFSLGTPQGMPTLFLAHLMNRRPSTPGGASLQLNSEPSEMRRYHVAGDAFYAGGSLSGLRGVSLKRLVAEDVQAGGAKRPPPRYVHAGRGWAPSDFEWPGSSQLGTATARPTWRNFDATAAALGTPCSAPGAPCPLELERAPAPQSAPAAADDAAERVRAFHALMRSGRHRAHVQQWAAARPPPAAEFERLEPQRRRPVEAVAASSSWDANAPPLPSLRQAPWMVQQQQQGFMTPAEAALHADDLSRRDRFSTF